MVLENPEKYYAGIGARKTPKDVLGIMKILSNGLGEIGYTLRSGGADGADKAFQEASKKAEIYLPWRNFNGNTQGYHDICQESLRIASEIHPAWGNLSYPVKKLMARNVYQIMGLDLKKETYSEFVICWTPHGKAIGGTAQAIRLAESLDIPVFNLGKMSHDELVKELITFWKKK